MPKSLNEPIQNTNVIEVPSALASPPIAPPSIEGIPVTAGVTPFMMVCIVFLNKLPSILDKLPPVIRVFKEKPKFPKKRVCKGKPTLPVKK